jgi:hypothetical protein
MKRRAAIGLSLALALPAVLAQVSISAAERARIDRLIDAVARSRGMYFVRNSKTHSADDAATFLREKMKAMGDDVRTAEEFIDKIATKSSMSGEAYRVRFESGREMTSAEFLRTELARIGKY